MRVSNNKLSNLLKYSFITSLFPVLVSSGYADPQPTVPLSSLQHVSLPQSSSSQATLLEQAPKSHFSLFVGAGHTSVDQTYSPLEGGSSFSAGLSFTYNLARGQLTSQGSGSDSGSSSGSSSYSSLGSGSNSTTVRTTASDLSKASTSQETTYYEHNFVAAFKTVFYNDSFAVRNQVFDTTINASFIGYSVLAGYELRIEHRNPTSNLGWVASLDLMGGFYGVSLSYSGQANQATETSLTSSTSSAASTSSTNSAASTNSTALLKTTPTFTDRNNTGFAIGVGVKLGMLIGTNFEVGPYGDMEYQAGGLSSFSAGIYIGF